MTNNEIISAVQSLNDEVFEKTGDEELTPFDAVFLGYTCGVKFLGEYIWTDDNDERSVLDEKKDLREPLHDFLRRTALEKVKKLASVWI